MKKLTAFFLTALLLTAWTLPAQASGDIYEEIDGYLLRAVENSRIPGMSVVIVDREKVLFSGNYGDCESSDTPFFLGSVSKSFTALCIMRLAEKGKLDIDAPLSSYLPGAAEGERLTLRQLLNQTGGLDTYQKPGNYRIVHPQGEHVYANVNYALLGRVVEAVSGLSYEEYVTENIFAPLGMEHSSAIPEEAEEKGVIGGYRNYFGFPVRSTPNYPGEESWIQIPAGWLSSSAGDLGRYLQMYLRGGEGIVSRESIDRMFYENVYVEDKIPFRYGMGWNLIEDALPEPVLRHSGLLENFTSCLYLLPESGLGIAVLVNTNDYFVTNDKTDRIGWSLALLLMGGEADEIGGHEYPAAHALYGLACLTVLASAVWPLFRLRRRAAVRERSLRAVIRLLLVHLAYPGFLLLIPRLFFGTPLWVARDFVPDLYLTLTVSAGLLCACGAVRAAELLRVRKRKSGGGR